MIGGICTRRKMHRHFRYFIVSKVYKGQGCAYSVNPKEDSIRILAAVAAAGLLSAMIISASPMVFAANQTKTYHEHMTSNTSDQHSANVAKEHDDTSSAAAASTKPRFNSVSITSLKLAMRDLWVDHVVWTRLYIIGAVAGTPDIDFAAQRLLKNQEDIGNAIKPFYGEEAGNKLTSLLKDHILIAVDLLNAAKAGDDAGVQIAEKKWYQNADEIATFLSDANPSWSKKDLVQMLDKHLALTKAEAVARLTGNYNEDVKTFDEIKKEAMMMADDLSYGIIMQWRTSMR
jgi:hypothetical protein